MSIRANYMAKNSVSARLGKVFFIFFYVFIKFCSFFKITGIKNPLCPDRKRHKPGVYDKSPCQPATYALSLWPDVLFYLVS